MAINITTDPVTGRQAISACVTVYVDRVTSETLLNEVAEAVRKQAVLDIQNNPEVQAVIAKAAQEKLLQILRDMEPKERK